MKDGSKRANLKLESMKISLKIIVITAGLFVLVWLGVQVIGIGVAYALTMTNGL